MIPQRKFTILVVDDTEATRYAVSRVLKADGFDIIEAPNGTEALRLAREKLPDLITLDIHLPDILGFEVCRRLKADPRTGMIPVLQVSASYVSSKDKIHGLEGGADSYLTHPVEPPVLVATVRALLRFRSVNEKLERSEEQLRLAVDGSEIGLWDMDSTTGVCHFSERARAIYGFPVDHPLSLEDALSTIVDPDRSVLDERLKEALDPKGTGKYHYQYRVRHASGDERWIEARGQTIFEGAGDDRKPKRFVGTILDISARKASELLLQEAKDAAETASRAKTQFLANISHEIRTPLGVILGLSELMKTEGTSAAPTAVNTAVSNAIPHAAATTTFSATAPAVTAASSVVNACDPEYIKVIHRNAAQLSALIDEILDLSKIEADRIEIEVIPFHVRDLINDVVGILALKAREKSLELQTEFHGEVPETALGDPTRIRQILINLVGNAIKFTEKGTIRLKISAGAVDLSKRSLPLRFDVIDSGIGLSEAQVPRLFQPFMQADSSTTRRFGGTGLGLTLSRRMARAMSGDLALIRSEPGRGSEFALTLTLGLVDSSKPDPAVDLAERKSKMRHRLQGMRILLVEDSPDNQLMVGRFLDLEGAHVELANNGEEGIEKALGGNFDVVLMDIQMPKLDGYEAVQRIREQDYRGPVVALTAHALKGEREKCMELGFSDYMTKPLNRPRLVNLLADLRSAPH